MTIFEPVKPPAYIAAWGDNFLEPMNLSDTIGGLQLVQDLLDIQKKEGLIASSPHRTIKKVLKHSHISVGTAHLELTEYKHMKVGILSQQKRKAEWTGGRTSGKTPVRIVGEALIEKNKKVEEARKEKALKRQKALGTRDSVIARYEKTLAVKDRKLASLKEGALSIEVFSRVENKFKEAQDTVRKSY